MRTTSVFVLAAALLWTRSTADLILIKSTDSNETFQVDYKDTEEKFFQFERSMFV